MKIVPNLNNNTNIYFKNNFNKITSKTAERLYESSCVPSGKNYGAYCYPTFVLDEVTGKIVEIFVKLKFIRPDREFYELYQKKGFVSRYIGHRVFNLNIQDKQIEPGFMLSNHCCFDGPNLKGVGLILNQITYERKMMLGFDNIMISCLKPDVLNFHKSCGFEEIIKDGEFKGYMRLSDAAKQDWEKIALRHPIFLGKDFPKELVEKR